MNDPAETIAEIGHNQPPVQTAIPEFADFERLLDELRENYADARFDLDDPEQAKAAKKARRALGVAIADLDRAHKELKAPLLEQTRLVDGERKRIKDDMLAVQEAIKDQIIEHQKREETRRRGHLDRIDRIRAAAENVGERDSKQITSLIDRIAAVDIDNDWEEYRAEAALAVMETLGALRAALIDAQAREEAEAKAAKAKAEAESKARAEREDRIRAEAEAKAKREAEEAAQAAARAAEEAAREKAEEAKRAILAQDKARLAAQRVAEEEKQARIEAEAKAKREAAEADRRYKAAVAKQAAEAEALVKAREKQVAIEAEQAAIEAEQAAIDAANRMREKMQAEQARKEKLAKEVADKEARIKSRKAHVSRVHAEILDTLVAKLDMEPKLVHELIEGIVAGDIPHMHIEY